MGWGGVGDAILFSLRSKFDVGSLWLFPPPRLLAQPTCWRRVGKTEGGGRFTRGFSWRKGFRTVSSFSDLVLFYSSTDVFLMGKSWMNRDVILTAVCHWDLFSADDVNIWER